MAGKNALLIVHGMGDAKKGSNLRGVAQKLFEAVNLRKKKNALVQMTTSSPDADVPFIDIRHNDDVYHIEEYWWAESFAPAPQASVAGWVITRATRHVWHVGATMLKNLNVSGLKSLERISFGKLDQSSKIDDIQRHQRTTAFNSGLSGDANRGIWQKSLRWIGRWLEGRLSSLFYGLVLIFLVIPVAVIGPILLMLSKIFAFIPAVKSIAEQLQKILNQIVVGMLGDIYVVMVDEVQANQLRDGLSQRLMKLGADEDIDKIVILAHSTGNLLAYDSLATLREHSGTAVTSPRNFDHLEPVAFPHSFERPEAVVAEIELNQNRVDTLGKIKSFVSIGSILTMAWSTGVTRKSNTRYLRPIPEEIYWRHVWTRFDIATGSELRAPEPNLNHPFSVDVDDLPVPENVRATNFGSLVFDHTGYWQNFEDVHFLLLEELGGRNPGNHFWRGRPNRIGGNPTGAVLRSSNSDRGSDIERSDDFAIGDSEGRAKRLRPVSLSLVISQFIGVVLFFIFLGIEGSAKYSGNALAIGSISGWIGFDWGQLILSGADLLNWNGRLSLAVFIGAITYAIAGIVWLVAFKTIYWSIVMQGIDFKVTIKFLRWIKLHHEGWRNTRAAEFVAYREQFNSKIAISAIGNDAES